MEQRIRPKNVGVLSGFSLWNNPGTNKEDFEKDPDLDRKSVV